MRGAHIGSGEDREEWRARGRSLDVGAASLFAVYETEHTGDHHASLAGGFDGGDGAASCGADVVDDDDLSARLEKAFDAASRAMRFLSFANQKPLDESRRWV